MGRGEIDGLLIVAIALLVMVAPGYAIATGHARRRRKNEAAWASLAKRLPMGSLEHPTGRPGVVARVDDIDVSAWHEAGELIIQGASPHSPELEVVITPRGEGAPQGEGDPYDVDVFDGDPTAFVAALRKLDLTRYRVSFSAHTLTLRWPTLNIDEEDVFRRVRDVAAVCASLERGYRG